jgi:MYXO-CTERM domain-containing protein
MWSASCETFRHFVLAAAVAFSALLATASAQAVLQPTPGGFTIPTLDAGQTSCADKNIEVCIDQSEGMPTLINVQADALVAPEVFIPTCRLTFKPIAKGGGDHVAFGWYNVKPDPANAGKFLKPTQQELFGMVRLAVGNTQGAALAAMFPEPVVLDLAAEEAAGRYLGGEIGFWLAGAGDFKDLVLNPTTHAVTGMVLDRVFYTQHSLNPGSAADKTFFQVLTWQSITFKNSFYFGWEDRVASSDADNDFDDLAFLVSGIQCAGGGEACDTGKPGVCKDGTMQCQKGELTCVQSIQPSAEKCNALDDDCNDMVDDGDLCEEGFVCDRGRCVPECNTGEFKCEKPLVCISRGVCVEPACATVECPAGQICDGGNCVDACTGVTCPYGTVCRNGGCADPCMGITCDDGFTCVEGLCQSCECSECTGGLVCGDANVCVDTGCETQTCAPGTHCSMGTCVDDCAGAVCPKGQVCMAGDCIADPNASVGGSGGSGGGPGVGGFLTDDPDKMKPIGGTASANGGNAGTGMLDPDDELSSGQGDAEAAKGCGCSVPGQQGSWRVLAGLALAAGLLWRRRRAA